METPEDQTLALPGCALGMGMRTPDTGSHEAVPREPGSPGGKKILMFWKGEIRRLHRGGEL